jgi:predicted RND superfamily exporter protein
MLFTSLILSLGFSVFLATYLINIVWFGFLAGFACAVAFLADVIVAPALMILVTRQREDQLKLG